jgi:glutamate 5-kinase
MKQKDHWISFVSIPKGRVVIDNGAATMLTKRGKSLLPAGVTGVDGSFREGDAVEIVNSRGKVIAIGLTNFTSQEVMRIKGANTRDLAGILGKDCDEEIVHRNNMILKGAVL